MNKWTLWWIIALIVCAVTQMWVAFFFLLIPVVLVNIVTGLIAWVVIKLSKPFHDIEGVKKDVGEDVCYSKPAHEWIWLSGVEECKVCGLHKEFFDLLNKSKK